MSQKDSKITLISKVQYQSKNTATANFLFKIASHFKYVVLHHHPHDILPLLAFGMQNTLVKFYTQYKTEEERSKFLSFTVLIPLLLCIPLALIGLFFFEPISLYLSKENPVVKDYLWLIPFIGLSMAYFEIFYAWARVHMHSVFGNFIKEVGKINPEI